SKLYIKGCGGSWMKNNELYIQHILECIHKIEAYTREGKDIFLSSPVLQDAVIRNLEIIGEATKKVTIEFRQKYPHVPWRQMAGLRDVLIHDYMGVDIKTVWNAVENDLPKVKKDLSAMV
ncbi:MAG: DUF86 domain-containing protein, partial [Bacillota bacterium]|nr:DUF86 domain-containing protein [Bacillota bacterium]